MWGGVCTRVNLIFNGQLENCSWRSDRPDTHLDLKYGLEQFDLPSYPRFWRSDQSNHRMVLSLIRHVCKSEMAQTISILSRHTLTAVAVSSNLQGDFVIVIGVPIDPLLFALAVDHQWNVVWTERLVSRWCDDRRLQWIYSQLCAEVYHWAKADRSGSRPKEDRDNQRGPRCRKLLSPGR